ncbi:MAG: Ig-like domain-containing protein [bacterium]
MKTSMRINFTAMIAAAAILAAFAFLAGCGGNAGFNPPAATAVSQNTDGALSAAKEEVYFDIDIENADGRTAGRFAMETASSQLTDILALKTSIENLPNKAFAKAPKIKIMMGEMKRRRLARITEQIAWEVKRGNLKTAEKWIERKLIPRVDGCSGGKDKDDYILDCAAKTAAYNNAMELKSAIENYQAANPKHGRYNSRAANISLAEFKTAILEKINNLKTYINGLPGAAFSGVVADPRGTLLDVLTIAANYALDGRFDDVKEELIDNFIHYVDGLNGDDLIVDATARANAYNSAQAIIQDVAVTALTVTPVNARMGIGEQQVFTAQCTYSNQYTEDCAAQVMWTSSNPAVGAIDATGVFTAAAGGTAAITASLGGVTSAGAPVMVESPYLTDNFDAGYLDPEKWNDFMNTGTIAVAGGAVMMEGPRNQYSEIATSHYFNVDPGEFVSFEVDIDLGASYGEYYVGGVGLTDNTFAGIAVGVAGGNFINGTAVYYASPLRGEGGSVYTNNTRSCKLRVDYQNGIAKVFMDGALVQTFAANLDGKRYNFFVFGSAGWDVSSYSMMFDNFKTNQTYPGETNIKIANNTNPFALDGSGALGNNDSYTITIESAPGRTVEGGIINPDDLSYIVPPAPLTEVAPGLYERTGDLPLLSATQLAATGSDDGYSAITLHTRRIAVAGAPVSRKSAAASTIAHPLLRIFPANILPAEISAE